MRSLALGLWGCLMFAPPVWAVDQIIPAFAAAADAVNADFYIAIGGSGGNATETSAQVLTSPLGIVTGFCAVPTIDPANGAGVQSWTVTARLAGSDTALSVVLSEGSTAPVCDQDVVSIGTAGQTWGLQITPANTPTVSDIHIWYIFRGNNPRDTWWGITGVGTNMSQASTQYLAPHVRGALTTTESEQSLVLPTSGTLLNLYVLISGAAGTGNSYTFDMRSCTDASPPVCSDTIVDCAISGASATTCNSSTDTAAIAAGLQTSLQQVPASTPDARNIRAGVTFRTDAAHEYILGTVDNDTLLASGTEYFGLHRGSGGWNASETNEPQRIGRIAVKAMHFRVSAAPDNGAGTQSYTATLRDDAADTGFEVAISETAVSGSDTAAVLEGIAFNSIMAWRMVPATTPTTPTASLSVVALDRHRVLIGGD